MKNRRPGIISVPPLPGVRNGSDSRRTGVREMDDIWNKNGDSPAGEGHSYQIANQIRGQPSKAVVTGVFQKMFQFETLSRIGAMRDFPFMSGKSPTIYQLSGFSLQKELSMIGFKQIMIPVIAAAALAAVPAMAQTTPNQQKGTTVTLPDGKTVHTPPRGMRSGSENVGGESGGS